MTFLDETEAREAGGNPVYAAGLRYNTDAQFHSGKYVLQLARGIARSSRVALFEAARVQSIETERLHPLVKTDRFTIRTERVFLSTNALIPQFVPSLAGAMRAERGQVIVTEPLDIRPCCGSFGTRMAWWREIIEPDGRFRLLFWRRGGNGTNLTACSRSLSTVVRMRYWRQMALLRHRHISSGWTRNLLCSSPISPTHG